jgi:hypothetical protein
MWRCGRIGPRAGRRSSKCLGRHVPPIHNTALVQSPACHYVLGVQVNDILADEKDPTALLRKGHSGSWLCKTLICHLLEQFSVAQPHADGTVALTSAI